MGYNPARTFVDSGPRRNIMYWNVAHRSLIDCQMFLGLVKRGAVRVLSLKIVRAEG